MIKIVHIGGFGWGIDGKEFQTRVEAAVYVFDYLIDAHISGIRTYIEFAADGFYYIRVSDDCGSFATYRVENI